MKWISVRESLPDPVFDWVLVFADGAMCTMAYTKEDGFFEIHGNTCGNVVIEEITHWTVLPEGPEM